VLARRWPTPPDRRGFTEEPEWNAKSPVADPRRPRDRRCVLVGWLLIVIIVILVLAVIGFLSLIRGRA